MKPIRLSAHAIGYISRRGFTKIEVEETIRTEEATEIVVVTVYTYYS
jgi:hypothetical protein